MKTQGPFKKGLRYTFIVVKKQLFSPELKKENIHSVCLFNMLCFDLIIETGTHSLPVRSS